MDLTIFLFWFVSQIILLVIGLGFRKMLACILAGLDGITLIVQIFNDNSLSYVSGVTVVSLSFGGYVMLPLVFVTLFCFAGAFWKGR
jgi:lysylphosphatidylglycerol synthetase-like protein (DUF2156 family)